LNIEVYANTPPQFNTTLIPYIADFIRTTKNIIDIKSIPPPYDVDNQNLELSVSCDGCLIPNSLMNPELSNLSSPSI
jgi:hypothetical protein